MGLISWMTAPFRRQSQPKNTAFEEAVWRDLFDLGEPLASGERVNWKTSLSVPAALRCGLVISDGISTVPCKLMRKDPATGQRSDATDHPLYWMFKRKTSSFQNSLEFRETIALHVVFTGAAYAFKNRVRGQIRELLPIPPHAVTVKQNDDYSLVYTVAGLDGTSEEIPARDIWHIRGPSWDGYSGLNMVYLLRNALGLSMATERAHASRFGNGVQTTGLYSVDGALDDAQYRRISAWIHKHFSGGVNSGKPLVLDNKATFTPIEMSGVDAQHVEARMLQIQEICTGFGVKPIMIGHADKTATYASAEQMFLAHAVHTIRPWHRRFEASMNAELLTEEEAMAGYYFKFIDTELLRGAAKDRADYYSKMFAIGGLSPNAIAEAEDMEGFDDGYTRYRPANMTPITAETNAPTVPDAPQTPGPAPAEE